MRPVALLLILPANVEASLYLGSTLLDAKTVALPPRDAKTLLPGASGVSFEMQEIESGILKLRIDAKDHLAADNTAFAVVNVPRPTKVLVVTPGNDHLEFALKTDFLLGPEILKIVLSTDRPEEGAELLNAVARAFVEDLGFDDGTKSWPISRLSTGERLRLALVRAIVVRPKVLLLDEPTAALDEASVAAVESLIASRMREGLAVLWVTHDAAQARRIADRQLMVEAGRVRKEGGR